MTGEERRARLRAAQLYLCVGIRHDMDHFLEQVLAAGVDIVQLRDKEATDEALLRAGVVFRAICDRHDALFIMNDRADLAVAAAADGVHVGQEDLDPKHVRAIVGSDVLIGRSTHASKELEKALTERVDYLGVGPVHATPTKPGREGVGIDYVRLAADRASIPWFVTGGMDSKTIPDAARAGARRFVVVRAINDAADPAAAAKELRALIPPLD